jgi:hypothetical protein
MASKIAYLSELENVLCNDEKTNEGVLHFFSTFKIGRFLGTFGSFKSKGFEVSVLLLSLLIFRLRNESIGRMQTRGKNFLERIDDNTFYRLMNNPWMNWRNLLMGFAKQFALHVKAKGDSASGTTCFVLDDTDIEKTGKTFEFVSRIFNHVTKLYPLGFKMLLLGFCDGKTLTATDCSLHWEKGKKNTFGLSKKELKSQFRKKRDRKSPGYKRVQEIGYILGAVISIVAIVGLINAFNLIDGIDGLAAGIGLLISLVYGFWFLNAGDVVYALACFSLSGSLIAFLLYNVFGKTNKIFMGDTGSLILGTIIAVLTIHFNEYQPVANIAAHGLPAISLAIMLL